MVASPADVKIVYTVAGVSKSITLLRLPSLSTFQYAMHCRFATLTYHQISLKRTSFLTNPAQRRHLNLSSMVEPGRKHHSPLHPLPLNKILERRGSITSEFLYTVVLPLFITKFSYLIGYRQP